MRVRIGIHTGEPVLTDEGYVGADVHRAARIMGAGHGGQILALGDDADSCSTPKRNSATSVTTASRT